MSRVVKNSDEKIKLLSACIKAVDTPEGRGRVVEYLRAQPYPHYESAPGRPGMLVRIDVDGKRTIGRFVRRRFKAAQHPH